VDQNLHDVDHFKVLLGTVGSTSLLGNEDTAFGSSRTRPGSDTHVLPQGNNAIANPSHWGNFHDR